jgi:hypothetical protein
VVGLLVFTLGAVLASTMIVVLELVLLRSPNAPRC